MGFADIADEDIARFGGNGFPVFSKKKPFPFQNDDAQLALEFMGVNGKLLAGLKIEIQDFEVRGVMHQQLAHMEVIKIVFREDIDFFHSLSPLWNHEAAGRIFMAPRPQ